MRRPYLLAALLGSAVALAALPTACGGAKVVTPSPTVIAETPTPAPATVTPTPAASPTATAGAGSRENPVPFGQSLLLSSTWKVTVIDVEPDVRTSLDFDEDGREDSGPPSAGQKHFLVFLRATNVSAGSPGTFPYGFEQAFVLGPEGALYGVSWPGVPGPLGDETLEGGSLEGPLPFALPEDATANILMLGRDNEARFFSLE